MLDPFRKPFDDIEADDLETLRSVYEGWFIEYKRATPSNRKLAKSLAAFANHNGGWLFLGVCEKGGGDNRAGSFPGLGLNEAQRAADAIRDAASSLLSHVPEFMLRTVIGPNDRIGLEAGKAIVICLVPPGDEPPYVTFDGRIYRRVADKSDPAFEKDKATVDMLVEKGRRRRQKLADFLCQELPRTNSWPRVAIFILSDPLHAGWHESSIGLSKFTEIAGTTANALGHMPMPNTYLSSSTLVARQRPGQPGAGAIYRYDRLCSSIVTLPLLVNNLAGFAEWNDEGTKLLPEGHQGHLRHHVYTSRYQHGAEFLEVLLENGLRENLVVDLNALLATSFHIIHKHRLLAAEDGVTGPFYLKVRLDGVSGAVPFFDTSSFMEFVRDHGVPVCLDDQCFVPEGVTPDSLWQMHADSTDNSEPGDQIYADGTLLFHAVISALGIPYEILMHENASEEVRTAMKRAVIGTGSTWTE